MKFTIIGFSQKESVKFGLDSLDLTILREFVDFKDSSKYSFYSLDKNYIHLINSVSKTSPKHSKNVLGCDKNLDLGDVHDFTLACTDFNSNCGCNIVLSMLSSDLLHFN
ncbi:hypothetical protein [Intestinibacter sp.]